MSQDLKEVYFPEDYGYVVNVDDDTKIKIGMLLNDIKKLRRELHNKIDENLFTLENKISKLYEFGTSNNKNDSCAETKMSDISSCDLSLDDINLPF